MAIFYVTKDPERATGIEDMISDYHVICPHASTTTESLQQRGASVFVIGRAVEGGTYGMLKLPQVQTYINMHVGGSDPPTRPNIMVLKNSSLIEKLCKEQNWDLWAPKSAVAKKYEEKITQYKTLCGIVPFPKTEITAIRNISWTTFPYIIQFNTGHSGMGTYVITNNTDLELLRKKFPSRMVRISEYIKGKTYTLNALVLRNGTVYAGFISLQLTGLPEATNNPLATVGNDFGAARDLDVSTQHRTADIAKLVGDAMAKEGYAGMFGIDVIVSTQGVFLVEVNTHQPASVSFEAILQRAIGEIPLMLRFVRDMMGEDAPSTPRGDLSLVFPNMASQIIYRNQQHIAVARSAISLPQREGVIAARMEIIDPGEELFRIQSHE